MKKSVFLLMVISMFLFVQTELFSAVVNIPNDSNWANNVNKLKSGDIAVLAAGTYQGGKRVTVSGVTIRGSGNRGTTIRGSGDALVFEGCSNTVLENVVISTGVPENFAVNFLDPYGGNYAYPSDPRETRALKDGIVIRETRNCVFRKILFRDVWTRGILAGGDDDNYNSGTLVENCLFYRVGQDTASGDINFNHCHSFTIRNNIFAGNVDGVVFQGAGGGGLVEGNIFLLGLSENNIDFKEVYKKFNESRETHMRYNVLYTDRNRFPSVDLNIRSNGIRIYYNKFSGNRDGDVIYFRGRGLINDIVVAGNWISGSRSLTTAFRVNRDTNYTGSAVTDTHIYHNFVQDVKFVVDAAWLKNNPNFNVNNNIFRNCGGLSGSNTYKGRITARNNMFYNSSTTWGTDKIEQTPVFLNGMTGLLAANSPGAGVAFVNPNTSDLNFGSNVGIPERIYNNPAPNFNTLESDILGRISSQLSAGEIQAVYQTAHRTMPSVTGTGGGSGTGGGTIPPANVSPVVTMTNPVSGTVLMAPASITLGANALDSDGSISKVEFYQGSTLIHTDTSAPYQFTWSNVTTGTYNLTARAFDNLGVSTTSAAVTIRVDTANALPLVSLTSPSQGTSFVAPDSINLQAAASDSDGSITKVEFFNGSSLIHTDTSVPYQFNWTNVAAGNYSLTARATDNRGAVTTSSPVTIQVKENTPPSIRITSPANGETIIASSKALPILVDVADSDGSIQGVAFYLDGKWVGHKSAAPFTHFMNNVINSVGIGDHQLMAVAKDDRGATTESAKISFTLRKPRALFISGERDVLRPGDLAAKSRLEQLGFEVSVARSKSVKLSDADGKELIVISSDLMSDDLAVDFKGVNVPLFTWEAFLVDDLGMTGRTFQNDYGMVDSVQTGLVTYSTFGGLNAGLSGSVNLYTQKEKMYYGVPNSNARNIVSMGDGTARSLMFAYEKGAVMPGLTAPARRVFFYMSEWGGPMMTSQGWSLFDAAIHWASGY